MCSRSLPWLILVALLPAAGISPATAQTDAAAVRAADSAWARAVLSKSIDQVLASYDPEALTAGPAMFPARGQAGFRQGWREAFSDPAFHLTWQVDSVAVTDSGIIAYSIGRYQLGPSGPAGPYIAVWRKQPDGKWKVLIDAAW